MIWPTKSYDEMFAHKSYVVKHDGVVYHFYCAVNNDQQRGIAVATSVPMGRSAVRLPEPERKGRRTVTSLNEGWTAATVPDGSPSGVTIPHNFDDYYGYRYRTRSADDANNDEIYLGENGSFATGKFAKALNKMKNPAE